MRSNKVGALLIAVVVLSVAMFSGCRTKETEPSEHIDVSPTNLVEEESIWGNSLSNAISDMVAQMGEDRVYECTQQNFSFLYDDGYATEWNERSGVTVYTKEPGAIPYLQIFRSAESHAGFDAKAHFAAVISQITKEYGDKLIAKSEYEYYSVAGKELKGGASIKYKSGTDVVEMLIVTELTEDSVVQYVCRYLDGQGDATLRALEKAVASYQPDANYYGEGGQGAGDEGEQDGQQPRNITLVEYDGGFFSVMLPEGWLIQTMGQYTTFGFRAWDPQNPDYEIFYYGNLGPLNKSYDAKNGWAGYIGNMGYPNAELNYDAPVVTMDSASSVFYTFDALQAVSDKYGFSFSLPALNNLMPQKSVPIETAFAQATTGESMMFAGVRGTNGGACGGMFMASLWNTNPYYVGGVDMTPTSAMHVTGVIAPTEDFLNVEATLTQAVFSLRFTEEYIQNAIAYSKAVGEAAMADNAARQAVFDKANKAWSEYFRGGPTIDSDNLNELNDLLDTIKDALG